MTAKEFEKLSLDLRKLAKTIPLNWGQVQNNRSDDKINMFSIDSYEDLEEQIEYLYVDPRREFYLRCAWESKRMICRTFSENIDKIKFFEYSNVLSAVIFILERETGVVSYKICGLDAINP